MYVLAERKREKKEKCRLISTRATAVWKHIDRQQPQRFVSSRLVFDVFVTLPLTHSFPSLFRRFILDLIAFFSFRFFILLVEGNPIPFAVNYTCGHILQLLASTFLCGPKRQFKYVT